MNHLRLYIFYNVCFNYSLVAISFTISLRFWFYLALGKVFSLKYFRHYCNSIWIVSTYVGASKRKTCIFASLSYQQILNYKAGQEFRLFLLDVKYWIVRVQETEQLSKATKILVFSSFFIRFNSSSAKKLKLDTNVVKMFSVH